MENALKAAFDWKTRLNFAQGIQKEASQVIHFKQAFHGRSGYTLSLTNTQDPRKYLYFPKFNWPRITNPKLSYPLTSEHIDQTIALEEKAVSEIRQAITANPNDIACIIIEPIQGEGGDNHFRKEFFVQLRQICDENQILLIFDEVQTGLGITGKMWAYQHYNVIPDVIAFGKKAQVCGILASKEKFDQVEHHVFQESSRINSTFGGDFMDMLRFKLILEVIEQENLVQNAAEKGRYLQDKLQELLAKKTQLSNLRGEGLFVAVDFESEATRNAFIKNAYVNKLIILGCGEKSIRFRPHLNVSHADIDKTIAIIEKSIS